MQDRIDKLQTVIASIGKQFWLPAGESEQQTIQCPVCNGNLAVEVILGTGERVGVPCEACGLGLDGPKGFIKEWVHNPRAIQFTIASVKSFSDHSIYVLSDNGAEASFDNLKETEQEALAVAIQHAEDQHERNMQSRQRLKSRSTLQRATWSIRYHRDCIKDLQRQIDWHQSRINSGKVKKEKASEDS